MFMLTEWMTFLPPKKNFKWLMNIFQGEKNRHEKDYFSDSMKISIAQSLWDWLNSEDLKVQFCQFVLNNTEDPIFISLVLHSIIPGWRSFHPHAGNSQSVAQQIKLV